MDWTCLLHVGHSSREGGLPLRHWLLWQVTTVVIRRDNRTRASNNDLCVDATKVGQWAASYAESAR